MKGIDYNNFDQLTIGNVPKVTQKHLAVLLIAIMNCVDKGIIPSRKVFFTRELEKEYDEIYKFYHLPKSSYLSAGHAFIEMNEAPFFSIQFNRDITNYNRAWNRQNIHTYVRYSLLDESVYEYFKDSEIRFQISSFLQVRYIRTLSTHSLKLAVGNTIIKTGSQYQIKDFLNEQNFMNFICSCSPYSGAESYKPQTATLYANALRNNKVNGILRELGLPNEIYLIFDANKLMKIVEEASELYDQKSFTLGELSAIKFYFLFVCAVKRKISK